MLKHGAHQNTINIKEKPDGLDFYYTNRSHAMKLIDFLQAVTPIKYAFSFFFSYMGRYKTSEKLISHDEQSNTYNYKFSFSVEMVPICRVCSSFEVNNI